MTLRAAVQDATRQCVIAALRAERGHRRRAARRLGITAFSMSRLIRRLELGGLFPRDFRRRA